MGSTISAKGLLLGQWVCKLNTHHLSFFAVMRNFTQMSFTVRLVVNTNVFLRENSQRRLESHRVTNWATIAL